MLLAAVCIAFCMFATWPLCFLIILLCVLLYLIFILLSGVIIRQHICILMFSVGRIPLPNLILKLASLWFEPICASTDLQPARFVIRAASFVYYNIVDQVMYFSIWRCPCPFPLWFRCFIYSFVILNCRSFSPLSFMPPHPNFPISKNQLIHDDLIMTNC